MAVGVRVFDEKRIVILDSTKRTPLYLGETGLSAITGANITIPIPTFFNGDTRNITGIIRVTNSNSNTSGFIKSISGSFISLFFEASKYTVYSGGRPPVQMNPHGQYLVSFYRW